MAFKAIELGSSEFEPVSAVKLLTLASKQREKPIVDQCEAKKA